MMVGVGVMVAVKVGVRVGVDVAVGIGVIVAVWVELGMGVSVDKKGLPPLQLVIKKRNRIGTINVV